MNESPRPILQAIAPLLAFALAVLPGSPQAAALTLADNPLFIPAPLAPNIVVTLDDSGSMEAAYVPDAVDGKDPAMPEVVPESRRFKSSVFNSLYYDPLVNYTPPVDASGAPLSTSFEHAWFNGFVPEDTHGWVDLSSAYRPTLRYNPSSATQTFADHPSADFPMMETVGQPAYYYVFNAGNGDCDGTKTDEDCYTKVDVGSAGDITPGTADEKKQNFANWYSFYRTRNLMTVTSASLAFSRMRGTDRVAWQALNSCNSFGTTCSGWDGAKVTNRVRTFENNRSDFYHWLFHLRASGDTPLRSAMQRAGEYFRTSGRDGPYDNALENNGIDTEYACRPNFHILMTDGVWTAETLSSPPGNAEPPGKPPFSDGNSDSLADIAYHYWATDLRGDLDNNLIPYEPEGKDDWNPKNDPADWQHMVNFTVGLGLSATLADPAWAGDTYAGGYAALKSGDATWPATGPGVTPGNVYDLWHAALNSRGRFFGVENPAGLKSAFDSILSRIASQPASATALAANSSRLGDGTLLFQAGFDSGTWSGSLVAKMVDEGGNLTGQAWAAAIPEADSRAIYTSACASGVACPFAWDSLAVGAKTSLGSSSVLSYLRGDQSQEQPAGSYRKRSSLLGDIINSDPIHAGGYDFGYSVLRADYAGFVNNNKDHRTKMLYVGANDGMLHAFDAATGVERFAYVPASVIPNLPLLTDPAYTHRYYVDGTPYVGDAYLDGAWKTLLLGTTGAGGRSVFALDVTDPDSFDASKVLWEFNDTADADLGYTLGQPVIARMHDGNWYAVFGNGYNSGSHHAVLFIVNLADGTLAKKIDLGATDPVTGNAYSAAYPNGLATPTLYDADGDRITDAIYAGDLQGNLWKIDVSSASAASWGVAYSGAPLFSARDGGGKAQPITAPVELGYPPAGHSGVMVFFGTGRYFATGDNTNTDVQSLYGILDGGSAIADRSTLQEQSILYQGPFSDDNQTAVRAISNEPVDYDTQDGWYLDLDYPSAQGERVVKIPQLRYGRVIFTTRIPSSDPCVGGGKSWTMALDANTGSRVEHSVFDLDSDRAFDTEDYVLVGDNWVPVSGVGFDNFVSPDNLLNEGTGNIENPKCPPGSILVSKQDSKGNYISYCERMGGPLTGRVSWREILD